MEMWGVFLGKIPQRGLLIIPESFQVIINEVSMSSIDSALRVDKVSLEVEALWLIYVKGANKRRDRRRGQPPELAA